MYKVKYELMRTKIKGEALVYEDTSKPYLYSDPATEKSDAQQLFLKTKEFFDRAGIKFALVCGTLLGAVRGKDFIEWDYDIDICSWDEEKIRDNLITFYESGLKLCCMRRGHLYRFTLDKSCWIDVYILRELKGLFYLPWRSSCLSLNHWVVPRKFFTGWDEVEFMGQKCLCPANPEGLLEFWYGSDWRIPQRKWGIYNVRSIHYIRKFFDLPGKLFRKVKSKMLYFNNAMKFMFDIDYREKILDRKKETGSYFRS